MHLPACAKQQARALAASQQCYRAGPVRLLFCWIPSASLARNALAACHTAAPGGFTGRAAGRYWAIQCLAGAKPPSQAQASRYLRSWKRPLDGLKTRSGKFSGSFQMHPFTVFGWNVRSEASICLARSTQRIPAGCCSSSASAFAFIRPVTVVLRMGNLVRVQSAAGEVRCMPATAVDCESPCGYWAGDDDVPYPCHWLLECMHAVY